MHILNVNVSIDSRIGGGTAERTYQLSRMLAKNGHKCTVLTLASDLTPEQTNNLADVTVVYLPYLSRRFYIPKFSLTTIKEIVSAADIIHLIGHWTLLNALIYFYAKRLDKPYVFCPAGALPIWGRSKILKKIYNWVVGNKIVRNANAHIAIAPNEIAQFKTYGIKAQQITFIPNGINKEDFLISDNILNTQVNSHLPAKYILFMGRLNYIKGPDLLLQAFVNLAEKFVDYHLVFAGPDNGMLAQLMKTAKMSHLHERVHFLGQVTGNEKVTIYQHAQCLVIPSRQEAMSIVVLEAGICAKPVLITDQCGFDDVGTIQGGLVVKACAVSITQGLQELLSKPTMLLSMGANLQNFVTQNFFWNSIIYKMINLYEHILAKQT